MRLEDTGRVRGGDLKVEKGRLTVIAGPSGSGKTTLLEALWEKGKEWHGPSSFVPAPSRMKGTKVRTRKRRKADTLLEELWLGLVAIRDKALVLPDGIEKGFNSAEELPNLILSLLQRGYLAKGSLLLIDEVEAGMHPETQLEFVKLLSGIAEELDAAIVVTTHSIYFLRAVEEYFSNAFFYLMEEDKATGFSEAQEVTGATERIYRSFFTPLEAL